MVNHFEDRNRSLSLYPYAYGLRRDIPQFLNRVVVKQVFKELKEKLGNITSIVLGQSHNLWLANRDQKIRSHAMIQNSPLHYFLSSVVWYDISLKKQGTFSLFLKFFEEWQRVVSPIYYSLKSIQLTMLENHFLSYK